jgi:hypothetical protein
MANVNDIVQESLVQMPESVASLIAKYSLERNPLLVELETSFEECDTCKRTSYSGHNSLWLHETEGYYTDQWIYLTMCPSCDELTEICAPRNYFRFGR